MEIRKYQKKDFEATKYVCINDMIGRTSDDLIEYVETMFCKYYLEKEPECCFVAVDEKDKPIGYVYGVKDYNKYQSDFGEYLKKIEKINNRKYLTAALTEMCVAMGPPPTEIREPVIMNVNRPFMFEIAEEYSNTILFTGIINHIEE